MIQRIPLNDMIQCVKLRAAQIVTDRLYKKYVGKDEWADICKAVDAGMKIGFFCEMKVCHGK